MKKILFGTALFLSLFLTKNSRADIWPAATGDSLTVEVNCLDSLGRPLACDSMKGYLWRFPTGGNRALVDSGRVTSFPNTSSTLRFYRQEGPANVYVIRAPGNATVGRYAFYGVGYGGTYAGTVLSATYTSSYVVGAATTTNYLANSDASRWNTVAVTGMPMPTYTQPTGFLAATFPSGTIANTTNITAGTITTTTNLTNEARVVSTDTLTTLLGNVNGSVNSVTSEVRLNSIDTLAQLTNEARIVSTETTTTVLGNVNGSVATATNVTTVNGLAANVITSASINDGAIAAAEIATDAIGALELATDAVNEIASNVGDTVAQFTGDAQNLVHDPGFESEPLGITGAWTELTATASLLQANGVPVGRKCLKLNGANAKAVSDSIYFVAGQSVLFGGTLEGSFIGSVPFIVLEDAAALRLDSIQVVGNVDKWSTRFKTATVVTGGYYRIGLVNGSNASDTSRFDQIFMYPANLNEMAQRVTDSVWKSPITDRDDPQTPDSWGEIATSNVQVTGWSQSGAAASTDSGLVARIVGRKVWGIAAGSGSDSTPIASRMIDSTSTTRYVWNSKQDNFTGGNTFGLFLDTTMSSRASSAGGGADSGVVSRIIRRMWGLNPADVGASGDSTVIGERTINIQQLQSQNALFTSDGAGGGWFQADLLRWRSSLPNALVTTGRVDASVGMWRGVVPGAFTGTGADTLPHVSVEKWHSVADAASATVPLALTSGGKVQGDLSGTQTYTLSGTVTTTTNLTNEARIVSAETTTTLLGNVNGNVAGSVGSVTQQVLVGSGDTISVDWGNIIRPTSTVGLTGTRIDSVRGSTNPIALTAAERTALFDTLAGNSTGLNLLSDPGFEGRQVGQGAWYQVSGTAAITTSATGLIKEGRKVLRIKGANAKAISDTLRMPALTGVFFGADVLLSTPSLAVVELENAGTFTNLAYASVNSGSPQNLWQQVWGYYENQTGTPLNVVLAFITATAASDSMRVDNAFIIPVVDTSVASAGGGGGSCTVTFAAGTGANTVTITAKDSAASFATVSGVFYEIRDSTSKAVQGRLPADQSGIATFSLNTGGYYMKRFKPAFRPQYGSSPSPQDSVYLRVSGATVRTDTIVGVATTTPSATGVTRVYGFVRNPGNDSNVVNYSVSAKLSVVTGKPVRCCTDSTSPVITVPGVVDAQYPWPGYWYIDLIPSAKYFPDVQYEITIMINGQETKRKVTVPDAGSWLFQFGN